MFDFNYDQILKPHKKRQATINAWKRMISSPISKRKLEFPLMKQEFGHWEGDLIAGGKYNRGCVFTIIERQSRFGITSLLHTKNATTVLTALKRVVLKNPTYPFKSMTFDNGLEFTKAMNLEKLGVKKYHAFPYSSWQRGRSENWNGILRRWCPKGTNFLKISRTELATVTDTINEMIRKILDWKTARQVLMLGAKKDFKKDTMKSEFYD